VHQIEDQSLAGHSSEKRRPTGLSMDATPAARSPCMEEDTTDRAQVQPQPARQSKKSKLATKSPVTTTSHSKTNMARESPRGQMKDNRRLGRTVLQVIENMHNSRMGINKRMLKPMKRLKIALDQYLLVTSTL